MKLICAIATVDDATAIATLRNAAADDLTARYGKGHWSGQVTEKGITTSIESSCVLIARQEQSIVGTLRLATKKPWAIDPTYFTKVKRPLYLLDLAVRPDLQRQGIGRALLDEASRVVRDWPAQAIWLDAYDGEVGAGAFYVKCGYKEVGRVTYRSVPLVYYEMIL